MTCLRTVLRRGPFADVEAEVCKVVLAVARGSVEARCVARGRQTDDLGARNMECLMGFGNIGMVSRGLSMSIDERRDAFNGSTSET